MSIQRRHLKSLMEIIDSDWVDGHMKKDLFLIHDHLEKEIKDRGKNPHFKDERDGLE